MGGMIRLVSNLALKSAYITSAEAVIINNLGGIA